MRPYYSLGFTLIEIVISLLLLTLIYLLITKAIFLSWQQSQQVHYLSIAESQVNYLATCTQLFHGDCPEVSHWKNDVLEKLPHGIGKITDYGHQRMLIEVKWDYNHLKQVVSYESK